MTQLMRDFDEYTSGIISKNERLEEENGDLKERNEKLEANAEKDKKEKDALINQLIDHGITPAT